MTQAKETPASRRCPRCGGLMHKPPGSSLYWHADNNHPRCDITNIVDTSMVVQASDEPLDQSGPPLRGKQPKK
jgi:ssDNA-binding Zn-finger/Zn-ribbon topoisomerase 1